jgi:hypothetical protein
MLEVEKIEVVLQNVICKVDNLRKLCSWISDVHCPLDDDNIGSAIKCFDILLADIESDTANILDIITNKIVV